MGARCGVSYVTSLNNTNSPTVCYRLSKILYNDTAFFRRNLTVWGIKKTIQLKKKTVLRVSHKLDENQRDQSKIGSQRGINVINNICI
jgi:hypothetical protein